MSRHVVLPSNAILQDAFAVTLGKEWQGDEYELRNSGIQDASRTASIQANIDAIAEQTHGTIHLEGVDQYRAGGDLAAIFSPNSRGDYIEVIHHDTGGLTIRALDRDGNALPQAPNDPSTLSALYDVPAHIAGSVTQEASAALERWQTRHLHLISDAAPDAIIVLPQHRLDRDTFPAALRQRGLRVATVDLSEPENAWMIPRLENLEARNPHVVVFANHLNAHVPSLVWKGKWHALEGQVLNEFTPNADAGPARLQIATVPGCTRCERWSKLLTQRGIPHEMVDVSRPENRAFAENVRALGYNQAPVTFVPEQWRDARVPAHFGDPRPDFVIPLAVAARDGADPTTTASQWQPQGFTTTEPTSDTSFARGR